MDENGEPLLVYHGTNAKVGDSFAFDYKLIGVNGSAEGYGFYFTSDKNTAMGYQRNGGSLIQGYLNIRKPMPLKQKGFTKPQLKKILKALVDKEIKLYSDEILDYRDSFLSNFADTYNSSLNKALSEAANMIHDSGLALDQISEMANVSGNKQLVAEAVREATGYDSVFADGYGGQGKGGGKIYVAWFPEQIKSTDNHGTFDAGNPDILYQNEKTQFITEDQAKRLDEAEGNLIRQEAINRAKNLENQGASAEEIYKETGVKKDENGKLVLEIPTAEAKLAKDVEAWSKHIDSLTKKPEGNDEIPMLTQTPAVYHFIGADFSALYVDAHMYDGLGIGEVKKGQHAHPEIDRETLKQLPEALTNPIAIFDYKNPKTGKIVPKSFVVMVNLKRESGGTVQTALHIKGFKKGQAKVNYLKTAYERTDRKTGEIDNDYFINMVEGYSPKETSLRYINEDLYTAWRPSLTSVEEARGQPHSGLRNISKEEIRVNLKKLIADTNEIGEREINTYNDLVNPETVLPGFYQNAPQGGHRASVTFGVDDLFALIKISKNADASSVMHELFHVHRRMWEEMYNDPSVSPAVKERYRRACEFVGAEPGKEWTVAQEEKFARAGERYLLEGESPHPSMDGVMENFKQWLYAIYSDADRAGLEISDSMRNVFAGMLGTAELGDLNFRYSMGRMLQYEPEEGIDTNVDMPPAGRPSDRAAGATESAAGRAANDAANAADAAANGTDRAAVQSLEDYAVDATARADEAFEALADNPAAQETIRAEYEAEMAAADAVIADAQREAEVGREAALCVMRG